MNLSLSGFSVLLVLSSASSVSFGELLLLSFAFGAPIGLDGDERSTRTVTRVIRRVSVDGYTTRQKSVTSDQLLGVVTVS